MQNRERENSRTINEHEHHSNDPETSFSELPDSFDEYEQSQISYQFRRWANNVWSLSNNVTNRLRVLLGNDPVTNIKTSNFGAAENGPRDGRNPNSGSPGWTTLSNTTEAPKHINDGIHGRPRYHRQHVSDRNRSTMSQGHYRSYGQIFSHVAEDSCSPKIITNRMETGPFVVAHGVATFPPVLVLPRFHQGVYRQPFHAGFHHSRGQSLGCRNTRGEEYPDEWYQRYHHSGIRKWGYGRSRGGENYSSLLERHKIPEKLDSMADESKSRVPEEKFMRIDHVRQKLDPVDCKDHKPVEHFLNQTHCAGFENGKRDRKSESPRRESRRLRREEIIGTSKISRNYVVNDARRNSSHSLSVDARSKVRKVVCDMKLSNANSREFSHGGPSRDAMVVESSEDSVSSNIEKKCLKTFVDQDIPSDLKIPVKDGGKKRKATTSSTCDNDSAISHLVRTSSYIDVGEAQSNGCQKQTDGVMTANSVKWSSVTENNFDSLLQSLREQMETFANIHPTDTGISKNLSGFIETGTNKGKVNLTVATCMAGNHLPLSVDSGNDRMDRYFVKANEDMRPSFSDRIQDIWRDNGSRIWRNSPRRETTSSVRYNFKSGKDVSSKLSLLGLNRQPALREYFSEYNSAVTLARILEKLIDTTPRTDNPSTLIPEMPQSKPRSTCKQSKTGLVDVGVQNSKSTSTTACQNSTANSRYGLLKKHVIRGGFMRTPKSRVSEVPVEIPRPLQVFSGQVIHQPYRDVARFTTPLLDTRPLSTSCGSSNVRNGHSITVNNPIGHETNPTSVFDARSRYSAQPHSLLHSYCRGFPPVSTSSQCRSSSSSSRRSSFTTENRRTVCPDIFYSTKNTNALTSIRQSIDKRENVLSTVVPNHIKRERQCAQFLKPNNATSPQRTHDGSLPVRSQNPRVARKSSDAEFDGISAKSRSWWSKKFHLSKGSTLKGKITSLLRYVMKKYSSNDNRSKKDSFEITVAKDVLPTPPIRNQRKCLGISRKISKSIQWDFDTTVLYTAQRVDAFQAPVIDKITVSTGTNTTAKKYCKTSFNDSTRKLSKQNKANMGKTAWIEISKNACTDSSNKGRLFNRTTLKHTKKIELPESCDKARYDNGSHPYRENIKSSSNYVQEEKIKSSGSKILKMSHSLSAELPSATKLVIPLNATQTIFTNRPNTAPTSDNLPVSYSLRPNVLLRDIEADKSCERDSSSEESKRKVLFKHNRSSLLRANNSMLKKSVIRSLNLSRKIPRDKGTEKLLVLTSSNTINEEESERLLPVNENRLKKLVSELEKSEENKNDRKTEDLQLLADVKMKNISELSSVSLNPEQKAKQSITGEKSYLDINGVSCPKIKHETGANKMRNNSTLSSNSRPISKNHKTNETNKEFSVVGNCISMNSEYSKEKCRSLKSKATPLNLELCCKDKKNHPANLGSKKLSNDTKRIRKGLRNKKDQAEARRDEILPMRLQEDHKFELTECVKSKEPLNKVSLSNSHLIEIQSDNDQKSIPNAISNVLIENIDPDHSTCETQIVVDGKTKLQSRLVYSTVSKTAEYFFKRVNRPVMKPMEMLQNEKTGLFHRSKRDHLATKSNKTIIKSKKLMRKTFASRDPKITKSNLGKVEGVNSSPSSGAAFNSRRSVVQEPGIEKTDSTSISKTARAASPAIDRHNIGKKSNLELIESRKKRNKNTNEIAEAVRRMIDAIISESVKMNRKTNAEVDQSEKNICNTNTIDFDKITVFSEETLLIGETVSPSTADETGEEYLPFFPLRQEEEFANSCSQGLSNICSPSPSSQFSSRIVPVVIGDGRKDFQEVSSSEKIPVTSESLRKTEAEDICTSLWTKRNAESGNDFAMERSQEFEDGFRSLFNLTEISDKPIKLRLSMANIHIQTKVESSELDRQVDVGESISTSKILNLLSNTDWDSLKVTDDGRRNSKCSKVDGNVKIDNKVLEERVKCSLEHGVPLKTITIMDPFIIRPSATVVEKNIRDTEESLEVNRISMEVLISSSPDSSSHVKREGQCSYMTWASQKKQNINMDTDNFTEDSKCTNSNSEKEYRQIIDGSTHMIDQNNPVRSTASVQWKKRATGQRKTSIPRYKKTIPYYKSVRNVLLS